MSPQEKIGITVFLCLIASVYIFAFGAIIRIILRKFEIGKVSASASQIWFGNITIVLAVIGTLCIAYAYFIEPYRLIVRNVEIKSEKVKNPIRIAHVSDFHSDPKPRLEPVLPAKIAEQKPDLIVFTGDSTNSRGGLQNFRKVLTEISKIAPTYVVRGNWDRWYEKGEVLFGETGAIELNGNVREIEIKGDSIWLSGIADGEQALYSELFSTIPNDKLSVFLCHRPDEIEKVTPHKIDLYVAGHTHGGQVALPIYGALITFSKYGKRFEGGTYKVDNTWLNVNRGIGMEGGNVPRVRFWATPEVTIIDILPK